MHEVVRYTHEILVGKSEAKRSLGKDNIKVDLKQYDVRVWTGFK